MAERRMFAKSIVLSDAFLDMSLSARCLYFTLGMLADDDGFVGSPKAIMRQCGASQDDMLMLIQKRYVLAFDSGVIVIKHWRINNYLREDRHKDTTYIEELNTLCLDEKGAYTEFSKVGIPTANQMPDNGLPSIDKNSIGKDKDNNRVFKKPSVEEVRAYCQERNNTVDPEAFINFYESKGWLIGKNKMKDWKAAVRTWERNRKQDKPKTDKFAKGMMTHNYDFDALEELMK